MRVLTILALLAVCVKAEDDAVAPAAEEVAVADDAAAEEGAEGSDEEKGQKFVDSATELQEKLAQLKALLDAKGDSVDPGLKEKLSGLEAQLSGLGLDTLTGGSAVAGSNPELTQFLGACVAMSMKRAGMQKPATLGALRKLVDGKMTPELAAKNDIWRMVGVCVTDLKEDEFADFKAGKSVKLPKAHVDASHGPEAEKKVLDLEASMWEELKTISKTLLGELSGDGGPAPPSYAGYIAMIPVGAACIFLGKLFFDMKKREEEAANKKDKKKSK